jgi:hypothetical protein
MRKSWQGEWNIGTNYLYILSKNKKRQMDILWANDILDERHFDRLGEWTEGYQRFLVG